VDVAYHAKKEFTPPFIKNVMYLHAVSSKSPRQHAGWMDTSEQCTVYIVSNFCFEPVSKGKLTSRDGIWLHQRAVIVVFRLYVHFLLNSKLES
jgi:hypothetical protein